MSVSALPLPFAGPGDGLERAVGADRRVAQVEAEKLEHLADYLQAAAREAVAESSLPGAERVRTYGGDGTPSLAEFTICEVGAALNMSPVAASVLVADVLDMTIRLPMLFDLLQQGRIEAWRVRKVASATREFSEPEAKEADYRFAAHNVDGSPLLARVTMGRLRQVLEQIRITAKPENADDDVESNLADRFIGFHPSVAGVADVDGRVSNEDAARLEQRIREVVGWLRQLGDERSVRELRSVAMAWLADPDRLGLLYDQTLRHDTDDEINDDRSEATDASEEGDQAAESVEAPVFGVVPEAFGRPRRPALPATTLYVHYDRGSDTWSLEGPRDRPSTTTSPTMPTAGPPMPATATDYANTTTRLDVRPLDWAARHAAGF